MAQGQISKEQIIEKDLFGDLIKSAKAANALIRSQTKALKKLQETYSSLSVTSVGDVKKILDGEKEVKAAVEINIATKKIEKNITEQLNAAQDKEVKAKLRYAEATRKQKQELKDKIILENKEAGTLERLSARNRQLRRALRELNLTTEQGRKLQKTYIAEINRNSAAIKQNSDALTQQKINIGNYKSALGGVRSALLKVSSALGLTAGIAALTSVFKKGLGAIADYEKQNSILASVLGTTKDQIQPLIDDSKRLGAQTAFSASQVSELQTAYSRLGFTQNEILAQTEPTLNLAAAANAELGRTAEVTGSVLNAFGLEATDTNRVVDVMAKSFSSSALDLEKFATSMATVAPVAKSVGFELEDTTAFVGKLVDAGFDASSAGTAFRNILLNLADSSGDLAVALGRPVESGQDLIDGLKELEAKGVDTAEALQLTDKRSVAAFKQFLSTADGVEQLTETLRGANGAAKEMADTQLDNLSGKWAIFLSQVESTVLAIGDKLMPVLKFVATNLFTIVKVLGLGAAAWVAYKIATIASSKASKAFNIISKAQLLIEKSRKAALFASAAAQALFTGNIKKANVAMKAFNRTTRANPLGLLLSAATLLIPVLVRWIGKSKDAERAQKELNEQAAKGVGVNKEFADSLAEETGKAKALFSQLKKNIDSKQRRNELINEINRQYPGYLSNLDKNKIGLREIIKAEKELISAITNRFVIQSRQKDIQEAVKRQQELITDILGKTATDFQVLVDEVDLKFILEDLDNFEKATKRFGFGGAIIDESKELTDAFNALSDSNQVLVEKLASAGIRVGDLLDPLRGVNGINNEAVNEYLKLNKQIEAYSDNINKLSTESDKLKKGTANLTKSTKADNKAKERQVSLLKLITDSQKDNLKTLEISLRKSGKTQSEIDGALRDKRIENYREVLNNEILTNEDRREIQIKLYDELEKKQEEHIKTTLQNAANAANAELKQLETRLLNEGKTEEEISEELRDKKITQLEQEIKDKQALQAEAAKFDIDLNDDIIDAELELAKLKSDLRKEDSEEEKAAAAAKQKQREKEIQDLQDFVNQTADLYQKIADGKKEQLSRELDSINTQLDEQRRLAEMGADSDLEFFQQKQAEKELEQKRAAEKEQQIQKGLAYFNLFTEYAKQNPDSAPLKAAAQILAAETFVSLFFKEGAERVGDQTHTKWRNTGTDDYLAAVNKGEKIFKTSHADRIEGAVGRMSNDEFVKWVENQTIRQIPNMIFDAPYSITKESKRQTIDSKPLYDAADYIKKEIRDMRIDIHIDEYGRQIERRAVGKIQDKIGHSRNMPN